jgi:hypothetical protein
MIWAFIYSNLIGNSIGLNICGMWVERFKQIIEEKQGQKIKDTTPPLDE